MREDDLGLLWEHWVLNELNGYLQRPILHYWRDKRGHEVDFVSILRGRAPIAIECKWRAESFEPDNFKIFRRDYPEGPNWVICEDVSRGYTKRYRNLNVEFMNLENLIGRLTVILQGDPRFY